MKFHHKHSMSPAVLVVDEDRHALDALREALSDAGYRVFAAEDPDEAVRAAQYHAPDLIITDVELAGSCGVDLCDQIRRTPGLEDVPVVFLSKEDHLATVRRREDDGATFYLREPYDPAVLLQLADNAMWMPHLVRTRIGRARISR